MQYVKNGHIKGGSGKYATRIVTADDVGAKNDKETLSDFVKAAAVGIENFFCDADLWCAEGEGPITTRCPIPKLGLYLPLMRCPDGVWKSTPRQQRQKSYLSFGTYIFEMFQASRIRWREICSGSNPCGSFRCSGAARFPQLPLYRYSLGNYLKPQFFASFYESRYLVLGSGFRILHDPFLDAS